MENVNKEILSRLNKIQIDIEFIKENIAEDFELSDWAKNELSEARKIPDSECVSHEEVKKMILKK